MLKNHSKLYAFIFLLVIFSVARLLGLQYGLPYMLAPDENRQILDAIGMLSQKTLIPHEYVYPALHKYLLMMVVVIYYIISRLIGVYASTQDFALAFLMSPAPILIISRLLSVFLGMGILLWIFQIGKRFFSPWGSWINLILVGCSFHFIQLSQWAVGDVVMVFFSMGCVYFLLLNISDPTRQSLLWSSIFLGLSISSKPNCLFLLGSWILSIGLSIPTRSKNLFYSWILYGLVPLLLASLIGNVAWLFKFNEALFRIKIVAAESIYSMASDVLFSKNPFDYVFWFSKEVIRQENALGVAFVLGILYGLWASFRSKNILVLTASAFLGAILYSRSTVRFVYYALPMYAMGLMLAGALINDVLKRYIPKQMQIYGLGGFAIFIFLTSGLVYWPITQKKMAPDTRIIAKQWVEKNIPYQSKIAMDWYVLNVPIQTKIPPYFIHSLGLAFYKEKFDPELKKKYESILQGHYYDFYLLTDREEEDRWPEMMPSELREKAKRMDILKRLYGRFLTPTMEDLQTHGIDYVILSSYGYTHFLHNEDLHKSEYFNPYFTEDTLSNHRFSKTYTPSPNGMLFFLIEHNRQFYKTLLENIIPKFKLIQQFTPHNNFGPIIEIYQKNG